MVDWQDARRDTTDVEVDALIAEFAGDLREAIRALLHDLTVLARDYRWRIARLRPGRRASTPTPRERVMTSVTYYAVLPFVRDEDGNLCPDEAVECPSLNAASTRARALVPTKAGAVAFSRTGDPETGEWANAVVLARAGDTPADLAMVSG